MNRQQRRHMAADARKAENAVGAGDVVRFLVARMADRSGNILTHLREVVGGEPTSGHVVSALMADAARFEEALVAGRLGEAVDAAVCVLFLARDLAIREGKIRIAQADQAPAAKA